MTLVPKFDKASFNCQEIWPERTCIHHGDWRPSRLHLQQNWNVSYPGNNPKWRRTRTPNDRYEPRIHTKSSNYLYFSLDNTVQVLQAPASAEEKPTPAVEVSKCGLCQDITNHLFSEAKKSSEDDESEMYPCDSIFSDIKSIMVVRFHILINSSHQHFVRIVQEYRKSGCYRCSSRQGRTGSAWNGTSKVHLQQDWSLPCCHWKAHSQGSKR